MVAGPPQPIREVAATTPARRLRAAAMGKAARRAAVSKPAARRRVRPKAQAGAPPTDAGECSSETEHGSCAAKPQRTANQSGPSTCLSCKAQKVGGGPKWSSITVACDECFNVYLKGGFTIDGDFESWVRARDADSEKQADFQEAKKNLVEGAAGDWMPQVVNEDGEVSVKISKVMIGLTRADLVDILHGVAPESLGIKLQDLKNESNDVYRGLLIPDPVSPHTRYEFSRTAKARVTTEAMSKDSQVFAKQAARTFDYCKNQLQHEKETAHLLTKIRTSRWTLEALREKAEEGAKAKKGNALAGVVARSADPAQEKASDSRCSASAEEATLDTAGDDESEEGETPTPSVRVLNRAAFDNTMAACSAKIARRGSAEDLSKPPSSAKKRGHRSSAASSAGDAVTPGNEPDDVIARRVQSLDIQKILRGESLGRQMRWARDTSHTLRGEGSQHDIDRLDAHIRLAQAATELIECPIAKQTQSSLESNARVLHEAGVELPTQMKYHILKKKINSMTAAARQNAAFDIVEFAKVSSPYATREMQQDECTFDAINPRHCDMEGSVRDKVKLFESSMMGVIIDQVKKGEVNVGQTVAWCKSLAHYLEESSAEDNFQDDYDDVVNRIVVACHAMVCIVGSVEHADHVKLLETFAESKTPGEKKNSPSWLLCIAIQNSPYYSGQLSEFKKHLGPTKLHIAEINNLVTELAGPGGDDGAKLDMLKKAFDALPKFQVSVRPGVVSKVEEACSEALGKFSAAFKPSTDGAVEDGIVGHLVSLKAILDAAQTILPARLATWKSELVRVRSIDWVLTAQKANHAFAKFFEPLNADMFGDASALGDFEPALKGWLAVTPSLDATWSGRAKDVMTLGLKYINEKCLTSASAANIMQASGAVVQL